MLGLIFPEKLVFHKGNYQTKEPNVAVDLIFNIGAGFKGFETKKSSDFAELSRLVVPTGIEPVSKV